jgi:hypothetical protein
MSDGFTSHQANTASAYSAGTAANRLALLRQAARTNGEEYESSKVTLGFIPTCACYSGVPAAPELPEYPDDADPPTLCNRCGGSGELDALPMFADQIDNRCPTCQGGGGTPGNEAWRVWDAAYQQATAERVRIFEHVKALGLPVVPCVVVDPFAGSGTTAEVAVRLRRSAALLDLNPEFQPLQRERLSKVQIEFL